MHEVDHSCSRPSELNEGCRVIIMEAERCRNLRRIIGLLTTIYSAFLLKLSDGESCPVILKEARISCLDRPLPQTLSACESAGCCWDETSNDPETKCYAKECKSGYFGWQCKFQCHCDGGADATCNRYTGECEYGCPPERWGVGCLLDSNCTYNDPSGLHYTGKKSRTDGNRQCVNWSLQKAYPAAQFPDKDITEAGSFCRNPKPSERKTWCYWRLVGSQQRRWGFCTLQSCLCPVGRFGINCVGECHCQNGDYCDPATGICSSGRCDAHWTGNNCQECSDGYFGITCESKCRCRSSAEVCDKGTGHCDSGCAPGWQGQDCQTECPDGHYGLNCELDCNCRVDGEVCNKTSGKCRSGCKIGYAGENCLIQLPVMTRYPDTEARNASSITIRWREWANPPDRGSGPVSHYIVYFKARNETEWTTVNKSGIKSAMVTNLQTMQPYQFRVAAVHSAGFVGPPSPVLTVTTCGRPLSGPVFVKNRINNPVTNSGASDDDDGGKADSANGDITDTPETKQKISIVVDWKLPSRDKYNCMSLRQYRVYTKKSTDDQFVFLHTVDVHRVTLNDIDPYANLSIGVSVVNNGGLESDLVETFYVGKSGPVQNFDVRPSSPTALVLRWAPNDNPNSLVRYYVVTYRVLRIGSCNTYVEPWSPLMDIEPDKMELELPDLLPYTRYQVKIWPHTEAGTGQEVLMTATTESFDPPEVNQFERMGLSSVTAKFSWAEVECRKWNGAMRGYAYRLVMRRNGIETMVKENIVNRTELEFQDLVPFTNYSIELWVVNHQYYGPRSQIDFTTFEDIPPPPRNIAVTQRLSESILFQWEVPDPPHGIILGYVIKYNGQQVQRDIVLSSVGSETTQFNATNLEPNSPYSFQVRAFTKVGNSTWSDLAKGFTDESIPGEPHNLRNVSRSSQSVKLQWDKPLKPNGVIIQYKITCSPVSASGKMLSEVARSVDPDTQDCFVDELKPGINYVCYVLAATMKGWGSSTTCLFWTEPEISVSLSPPVIESSKFTDTSVAIFLPSVPSIEFMDEADRLYCVVIEKRGATKRRKKRSNEDSKISGTPCGLKHSDFVDYARSKKMNVACYLAAEFFTVHDNQPFIVGDNKTYGGYYNGPLDKDTNYDIWFGVVITVDGVTTSSYSKTGTNHIILVSPSPDTLKTENNENAAMAGAIVGALAAIGVIVAIIAIVIYKVLRRKKMDTEIPGDSGSGMDIEKTEARQLLRDDPSSARDAENQHRPIPVEDLWSYVMEKKMSVDNGFRQEYEEHDQTFIFKHEVAKKLENRLKNRYGNIVAYDHSRVVLDCLPDDPHSDYINANYIDSYRKPKAFIAAQGPTKSTLNDIWRMTWQLHSTKIVMVTNLMEDGRHKCEQYWPEQDNPKRPDQENPKMYGDIQVTMIELEQFADFKIRTFFISQGNETRTVRQFHFTAWPDHGVPMYPTSLLAFRKKVRSFDDPSNGPTIVHCSAGVGRSGTFIALDFLLDQAKAEGKVDIYNCVKQMRNNRVNMVQTLEQYIFVYDALLEALKCGDTSIPCVEFQKKYCSLQTINPQSGQSFLKDEFDLLGTMILPAPADMSKLDAWSAENIGKNRFKEIVPVSRLSRPYLRSYISGSSDYINAVYTDGYKQRDVFIVTQTPLPTTVVDFWAMIADHSCHTIVTMDDWDPTDPTIGHYFPRETGSLTFGPFTVDLVTSDESNPSFAVRDFSITYSKRLDSNGPVFIRHFQYKGWPKHEALPTKSSMISLLLGIEKWQQRSGNTVIVVHCLDGAIRSGLLCAVSYMVERLKVEQDIDVFQSVKHVRINRSQLIPLYEQYQFLYDMAVEYMACFDTYANFK